MTRTQPNFMKFLEQNLTEVKPTDIYDIYEIMVGWGKIVEARLHKSKKFMIVSHFSYTEDILFLHTFNLEIKNWLEHHGRHSDDGFFEEATIEKYWQETLKKYDY